MGCVLQPAAPQELAEQVPEHGAPNQGEWMGEDAWGRPIAFHRPGPPAAIDLSKCEPRSNLWAQHCSAMGCPSWIWCSKTNERATCTHCGRPWIRSFIDNGPHFCGNGLHLQTTMSKEAMTKHQTKGTRTKGIGDHAMEKDHAVPIWVATSIQWPLPKAAMSWQVKKKSAVSWPVVFLSYHSIFSMRIALKAPILAPSAFGMPPG